jgi:enoyl-CoA hydratase/carnithine racemase
MTTGLTQFTISEVTPAYWHVSFSNPPINLQDPDTILELQELVGMFETDDALRVVVLESADPNFFINHYDVSRAAETPVAPGPTGLPTFIDTTMRLATTSVVTIAKIRGRNRGGRSRGGLRIRPTICQQREGRVRATRGRRGHVSRRRCT